MILQPSVTDISPSRLYPKTAFDPSTRSVLTKIRIKQGDTISIAGLIQKNITHRGSKVPILGDIPLVGALFKNKNSENAETDLIVFITPYILEDNDMMYLQKRVEDEDDYNELVKESKRSEKFANVKEDARVLSKRISANIDKQSLTQKILSYEDYVQKHPADPLAHSNLGVAYAKAQKYDLAIDEFKKSIMLDPQSASAYNNLGNLYRIKKEYGAAISSLKRAIELAPNHPYAYTTLGLCYEMKTMYDEARQAYVKAVQMAPESSWTNTARDRLSVLDARI